ncbi:MAG: AraC family transcriptional regulator [Pseudomonadota bacterium]
MLTVFVVFDNFLLLDLSGPLQVFASANEMNSDAGMLYDLSVVSVKGGQVRSSAGVSVMSSALPATLSPETAVIIVGGPGVDQARSDAVLIPWIAKTGPAIYRISSVCTGAFLLAEAGLLKGMRAATHWNHCDKLQRAFADVRVDAHSIFVREASVWTSAGITAGMDLALAQLEDDHGSGLTNTTAKELVLYSRRPGKQSQFSSFIDLLNRDQSSVFSDLHQWILSNIDKEIRVSTMAQQVKMSERSFARKYVASIGLSPAAALCRMRAEFARNALIVSDASLKTISFKSGFKSIAQLNRVYRKCFGISPQFERELRKVNG